MKTICGQGITIDGNRYECEQNGPYHDFHKFTGLNGARIWVQNMKPDSRLANVRESIEQILAESRKDYATRILHDHAATDVAHLLAIVVLQLLEISEKIS